MAKKKEHSTNLKYRLKASLRATKRLVPMKQILEEMKKVRFAHKVSSGFTINNLQSSRQRQRLLQNIQPARFSQADY